MGALPNGDAKMTDNVVVDGATMFDGDGMLDGDVVGMADDVVMHGTEVEPPDIIDVSESNVAELESKEAMGNAKAIILKRRELVHIVNVAMPKFHK
ncbi:hypothetical protein AMTR_s00075p00081050, partial [Amborella trichopoda]